MPVKPSRLEAYVFRSAEDTLTFCYDAERASRNGETWEIPETIGDECDVPWQEEEIKRLEIEERAKEEKSMQQRLEQEKLKLEQQRKNSIKTKIVEDTQQQFNEKLSDYTKVLIARVKEEIDRVSTNITEAMLSFVNTQIEEVEAKLKEILEKRSHTEYDQNKEQEDILNQLTKLEIPNE